MERVASFNVHTDDFKEHPMYTTPKRSYQQNTFGVLIQNTWTIHPWFQTEAGVREDY
ncbi:MAG TPA: hypothetical protein VL727_08015 [Puia sp.]|nr:hypothetical protein [Puia sp.]